ncbi:porin family protein [bacterium]|nr:porin family protein [bacterium]
MKSSQILFLSVVIFSLSCFQDAKAVKFENPIGLTYISGFNQVVDIYWENIQAEYPEEEGYSYTKQEGTPIGLSYQPYLELDMGIRIGVGIGPLMYIYTTTGSYTALPYNINAGFTIMPSDSIGIYGRAGMSVPNARGEYVKSYTSGFMAGFGMEFMRNKTFKIGFELGYDSSTVELQKLGKSCTSSGTYYTYYNCTVTDEGTETVTPIGAMASFYIILGPKF